MKDVCSFSLFLANRGGAFVYLYSNYSFLGMSFEEDIFKLENFNIKRTFSLCFDSMIS